MNPDRPLPPEHYDGCTCIYLPSGRDDLLFADLDCAVHAPRYLTTLDPEERSGR